MTFKVLATFGEAQSFEAALTLAGASPQPEFEELRGDLFLLKNFRAGTFEEVFILQIPADDELTEAEADEIAEESLHLAGMLLKEMGGAAPFSHEWIPIVEDGDDPFPRHDPPGIG